MVPFKPETFFKNSQNWDKKQQLATKKLLVEYI